MDENKKFILCCPLKAVVEQHTQTFEEFFRVLPISSDYQHHKSQLFQRDIEGFIVTYEMIYQIMLKNAIRALFFPQIGGIIFDESHLLGTKRGPVMESFIYLVQKFFPNIQLLFLSATTGNAQTFAQHFNAKLVKTSENERPIQLYKYIRFYGMSSNKNEVMQSILYQISQVIEEYKNFATLPQILIFCQSRRETKYFLKLFKLKYPKISADYHHAGRSLKDRQSVEDNFRNGDISIIFSTPTLTMGVNIPADIVVVTSITRFNRLKNCNELIDANELLQMIGRAGRPGQRSVLYQIINGKKVRFGCAYILCERKYYNSCKDMIEKPVIIQSQILTSLKYILCTWVCGNIRHVNDLVILYNRIFITELKLQNFVDDFTWLVKKGFLAKNQVGDVSARHKAEIVAHYALQPETIQFFYRMKIRLENYENSKDITPSIVIMSFLSSKEFLQLINVDESIDYKFIENAKYFSTNYLLKKLLGNQKNSSKTIKKIQKCFSMIFSEYLLMRYHLFAKLPINYVKVSHGDYSKLYSNVLRYFSAIRALFGENWKFGRMVNTISKGLTYNPPIFDSDLQSLLNIKGIGIKTALLLFGTGIKTPSDLIHCNIADQQLKIKRQVSIINKQLEEIKGTSTNAPLLKKWRNIGIKTLYSLKKSLDEDSLIHYSHENSVSLKFMKIQDFI